jgi:hypothetical protein
MAFRSWHQLDDQVARNRNRTSIRLVIRPPRWCLQVAPSASATQETACVRRPQQQRAPDASMNASSADWASAGAFAAFYRAAHPRGTRKIRPCAPGQDTPGRDGVNIAARLEGIAKPGVGPCCSMPAGPVIIVPDAVVKSAGERVVVAWKDTREARHDRLRRPR